ncbi:MAG: hypothetical protein ORN29_02965, partial [Rhodoferax sp.]|nr:hypothetical protein [Rhodoferax sp.]
MQSTTARFAAPKRLLGTGLGTIAMGVLTALVLNACGGSGITTDESGAGSLSAASATGLRTLPSAFVERKAVAYSPYRTSTKESDRASEVITDEQVKQDLDLLKTAGIGLIRLFDSSDKVALRTLRVIRANNLDIKVMLGVYVNTFEYNADPAAQATLQAGNEAEMARGVALANTYSNEVVAVSVGNETMVDWSFVSVSTKTMAGYIKSVRDRISQPVTTDDNYAFYAGKVRNASEQAAEVFRQIDFASIHSYPLEDALYSNANDQDIWPDWDWQQLAVTDTSKRAEAMMQAAIGKLKRDYAWVRSNLDQTGRGYLPIVIGETGWRGADPGSGQYRYMANPVNQKMYYALLLDWALASRNNDGPKGIVYFEAFDEPWKGNDDKWGLFNVKREARCAAQALNPAAAWARETASCEEASATYYAPPAPSAAVTAPQLTIFNESVTGWPVGMRADAYEGGTFVLAYP